MTHQMSTKESEFREKLKLVKEICEEECNLLYLTKDIDVTYDHYCSAVRTVYLREALKTTNRVTHTDVEHIEARLREEVETKWQLGLIVSRPEMAAWYTGEEEEDNDEDIF